MPLRSSSTDLVPDDPVGEAVAATIMELLGGAVVEQRYAPDGSPLPAPPPTPPAAGAGPVAVATGTGPPGWQVQLSVRLAEAIAPIAWSDGSSLRQMVADIPVAALNATEHFRGVPTDRPLTPALHQALRDTLACELLARRLAERFGSAAAPPVALIAAIVDYLVELTGTRVESHDLTHGVVVTDALPDEPRLRFDYPHALRSAKRGPILFDGMRSVLVVDVEGRARTELQRHRLDRLVPEDRRARHDAYVDAGSLVAEAARRLRGVGFFLRGDRTIWTFLDGQPLLVRRGAHWTAFPLELEASIGHLIGGGPAARLVVEAAFMLSAQARGAILAVVEGPGRLDGIVSDKDRFDLRNDADPLGMRVETRLHHLIDADPLDEHTLARLAALDGATILDRDAHLLAYGAIVTSSGSQYEGARTAAAKTLSESADVVLKVSMDGDITVFHAGQALVTLLGQPTRD